MANKELFEPDPIAIKTALDIGLKAGVGGVAEAVGSAGLGCGPCSVEDVRSMLALGSPRLALAKALGVPLAPWTARVAATFSTVSQPNSPDNGQDVKIVQDIIIDKIRYHIDNQSAPPAGDFDAFNNYYFMKMSNIEGTLKVSGAPRYEIFPNFTPLREIERLSCGWVLTNTQGLLMSFQSNVALPFAPIKITFVFEGRTTHWAKLIEMTNSQAVRALQKLGYDLGTFTEIYC